MEEQNLLGMTNPTILKPEVKADIRRVSLDDGMLKTLIEDHKPSATQHTLFG